MSRCAICFVLIVAFCALVGCGGKSAPAATGPKATFDNNCASCHARAGEPGGPGIGGSRGPDLSKIGKEHDAKWLAAYISDPNSVRPDAKLMPAFKDKLTEAQIRELAEWLAARK
jgi:mono/diheme cytochrome c family protein